VLHCCVVMTAGSAAKECVDILISYSYRGEETSSVLRDTSESNFKGKVDS